jgi:predicted phosphodiesterase
LKIGIISDLHCDVQALETALKELRGVDQVICAGDLNLQYRFSNEISELMQRYRIPVVRGNHDTAILSSAGLMLRNSGQIKPENLSHLRQMPLMLEWPIEGKRVMMMHTSPLDPTGGEHGGRAGVFLPGEGDRLAPPPTSDGSPDGVVAGGGTDDNSASGRLAKIPNHLLPEAKADVLIVGHTHRTMVTHVDNTLIVNPGSLGQPRDPKRSTLRTYAILDTSTWEASIHGFEQARDTWG